MRQLSSGHDSTLANWRLLSAVFFGEHSAATKFLDKKIDEYGAETEVTADERQLVGVLGRLAINEFQDPEDSSSDVDYAEPNIF